MNGRAPRVVALAGGVGGAKLVAGLAHHLPPENLTVVVNTGDDFDLFGLRISPDLDTVCYTLAGLANPQTGWGRAQESWRALEQVEALGGPGWFRLGDLDLGTHLERTRLMQSGWTLSEVTARFCLAWGIAPRVVPMSDQTVATRVMTNEGELDFQDYFVRRRCEPQVRSFRFEGVESAQAAPGVKGALEAAEIVIFCPSNPWVSLDPILAVAGIRNAIQAERVVAVSPLVGGQALKGPAAKMYRELGLDSTALAVARHYQDLLTGFVLDQVDAALEPAIKDLGVQTLVTDTIMDRPGKRAVLAGEVLKFCERMFVG